MHFLGADTIPLLPSIDPTEVDLFDFSWCAVQLVSKLICFHNQQCAGQAELAFCFCNKLLEKKLIFRRLTEGITNNLICTSFYSRYRNFADT